MRIDYKTTVWCSVHLPDDVDKEAIIKRLNDGEIPEDFFDIAEEYDTFLDTERYITPEENKGRPTMELIDNDEKSLWVNG